MSFWQIMIRSICIAPNQEKSGAELFYIKSVMPGYILGQLKDTFPIKKGINTELFIDRTAALFIVNGRIKKTVRAVD